MKVGPSASACRCPEADKFLIKPRQVGQAGAGNPRDRSNERHALQDASILESHPALPTPAWSINPTGPPTTLPVFSLGGRCQGECGSQKNTGMASACWAHHAQSTGQTAHTSSSAVPDPADHQPSQLPNISDVATITRNRPSPTCTNAATLASPTPACSTGRSPSRATKAAGHRRRLPRAVSCPRRRAPATGGAQGPPDHLLDTAPSR